MPTLNTTAYTGKSMYEGLTTAAVYDDPVVADSVRQRNITENPKKRKKYSKKPALPPLPRRTSVMADDALLFAAEHADLAGLCCALALGANVNCVDLNGYTPLMLAAANGCVSIVQVFSPTSLRFSNSPSKWSAYPSRL